MIKSISLHNFQSHTDTDISFHPGVNVIVGPSDSGKTAITRALYWALFNQPSGDEFRRHGEDETKVRVDMKDCRVLRWKKGASKNRYALDLDGEEQTFEAFGASVPEPIQQAVNMTAINWQRQLDAPFLLSDTAGEVARQLNEITRLDVIDTALASVAGKFRETKRELDSEAVELESARAELARYKPLDDAEAILCQAEQCEADKEQVSVRIARMECLREQAANAARTLKQLKPDLIAKANDLAKEAMEMASRVEVLQQSITRLSALHNGAVRGANDVVGMRQRLAEMVAKMPKACPACGRPYNT